MPILKSPLISIVMPVKNATPYLSICLDSILQQTHQNWELLAVNDHSEDKSEVILRTYAEKDARIQIFNNQGKGIIDALRLAYAHSSGAFITRMDADDHMVNDKLEIMQTQLFAKGRGYVALGLVKYFSDDKELGQGYQGYEQWLNGLSKTGSNFQDLYRECVIPSPCWMLHRSDFEACGGFTPNTYPEDYDLCFRYYANGLKCLPSNKILHYWRDYDNRTSRTSPHYADNRFLSLKCAYFAQLHHKKERQLMLWGAGKKGKKIAQNLQEKDILFEWVCNNPNKIGKHIYGCLLQSTKDIQLETNLQIIIAVANPQEQIHIKKRLQAHDLQPLKDYYFFC